MADLNDELTAAILGVIGEKSRDGLTPQGEAAVRLALHCADLQKRLEQAPVVEIEERLNQPKTCRVYREGVLVFSGRDHSADLTVSQISGRDHSADLTVSQNVWHSTGRLPEDGHLEVDCPGETCPVVIMLAEHEPNKPLQENDRTIGARPEDEPQPNEALRQAAERHREQPAFETDKWGVDF